MSQNKMTAPVLEHRDGRKNAEQSRKARILIVHAAAFVCKVLAMGCVSIALAFMGCAALAGIPAYMGICAFFATMAWALGALGEVLECAES